MPDKRGHRGPHPEDGRLFAEERWPALRGAVSDLSWLLTHEYGLNGALKLVGDRYQLDERQRLAVMRSTCSEQSRAFRRGNELMPGEVAGRKILLDGYNVLTTVEAALGGGVLLRAMDGCLRDMASLHGHYKRVAETGPALELIGATLAELAVGAIEILLDAPVSNSGRLKTVMRRTAEEHGWTWAITLVPDPDPVLARSGEIIATADSAVLDGVRNPAGMTGPGWVNLAGEVVKRKVAGSRIVEMSVGS
jgi:hypothetical protein